MITEYNLYIMFFSRNANEQPYLQCEVNIFKACKSSFWYFLYLVVGKIPVTIKSSK